MSVVCCGVRMCTDLLIGAVLHCSSTLQILDVHRMSMMTAMLNLGSAPQNPCL